MSATGRPGAEYECVNCGYRWTDYAGPQDDCARCGSVYMRWLNYEEMFGRKPDQHRST